MSLSPPEQLRALLAQPPGPRVWLDLNTLWDQHPALLEEPWRAYALDHLEAWPDSQRPTRSEDITTALRGAPPERLSFARTLNAASRALNEQRLQHLLAAPQLEGLRGLNLSSNRLREAGARVLGESPQAGRLQMLELKANNLGVEATRVLALSGALRGVQHLDLSSNSSRNGGLALLAEVEGLEGLRTLHAANIRAGEVGLEGLLRRRWEVLEVLDLHWNHPQDAGAEVLAERWAQLPALRKLNLRGCELHAAGARALLAAVAGSALVELNLAGNRLSAEEVAALAARCPTNLQHLNLGKQRGVDADALRCAVLGKPGCVAEEDPYWPFPPP